MKMNIVKIEAKGFQDLCNHIRELEEKNKILENKNKQLKADNKVLGSELTYFKEYSADLEYEVNKKDRMVRGLKLNNSSLTLERKELLAKIHNMENTHKYLTSDDVGKHLAMDLLGKTMSAEDLAIEAAENAYKPYSGDDF